MRRHKKLIAFCTILGAGVLLWMFLGLRVRPIAATNPSSISRFSLGDHPMYLQTDARWAKEPLGRTQQPLRSVGCTVCSVSMALAYLGVNLEPGKLNREIQKFDGFTEAGWIKWNVIEQLTGGKVRVRIPWFPSQADIDHSLAAGNPVLAKIRLPGGILHWVLIVGREGREYLIKDPLGDGITLDKLTKYGSDILAIRIIEPTN